jgi:ABC-type transport system involved in multi-copper enzyme maturation permease subunit
MSLRAVWTIARYGVLESLRGHLVWAILAIALTAGALAAFSSEISITEAASTQALLMAAMLRLAAVFLVAAQVTSTLAREFQEKNVDLLLALPLPRHAYVFGKLAGFQLIALATAGLYGLLLLPLADPAQVGLWTLSLALELALVVGLGFLCVITFTNTVLALTATLAAYFFGRMIAAIQAIGHNLAHEGSGLQKMASGFVDLLALFTPHMDRFTRSEWLAYGTGQIGDLTYIALETLLFVVVLCGAILFDFYRKNL